MSHSCHQEHNTQADHRITTIAELRTAIRNLPKGKESRVAEAAQRDAVLTKPPGSLGRLEELTSWLCKWQDRHPAKLDNIQVCVFAGNHGIAELGVSAFPMSVTTQMVQNFEQGGAAINQLAAALGAKLTVAAIDLDQPVLNFVDAEAMDESEFVHAFNVGVASVDPDADLLCIGEMGIGNTTSAPAVCFALWHGNPADWCGFGSGVNESVVALKARLIQQATTLHAAKLSDALETLRVFGGREMVAMAGAVYAARMHSIPTLLDGFICCSAAAPLYMVSSDALDHCKVGHSSMEPGHRRMLAEINQRPLLNLDLRLGEGSGAALAAGLVKSALLCHNGMATFESAGVSTKER